MIISQQENFITPGVFGDFIYENFLFDVAKLIELSVLYGGGNADLLGKMIENIFRYQPKFNEDLVTVVPDILKVIIIIFIYYLVLKTHKQKNIHSQRICLKK